MSPYDLPCVVGLLIGCAQLPSSSVLKLGTGSIFSSAGSQNTPSSAAPQRKTDEAHSREISPDVPEPEPEVEEVAEVEEEIQPQPVTRTREAHEVYLQRRSIAPQRKKKSK